MRDSRDGFRTMTVGELKAALAPVSDDLPVVVEVFYGRGMSFGAKVDDTGIITPKHPWKAVKGKEVKATTNFVILGNAWDPDRVIKLRLT